MHILYYDDPVPHVIIDNFYTFEELNLIADELKFLTHPTKMMSPQVTGSAVNSKGDSTKKNYGLFLDSVYSQRNISDILTFSKKLFEQTTLKAIGNNFIGRFLMISNKDTSLLSYYEDSDHYLPHFDSATLTACTWLFKEPKKFVGGDFKFSDYNYNIQLKNNRMIIFPSPYNHEVSSVKMLDESYKPFSGDGRYVITNFIYCNNVT